MSNLEPLAPTEAFDWYIQEKETEAAASTVYSHKSRIGHFLRWCDERGIDNMNDLTGRDMHRYKVWRRDEGDLNRVSVKTQMDTIRVFIRWCEHVDAVEQDLSTKVQSPTLEGSENARDVLLDKESAEAMLSHLATYAYASIEHVALTLLWRTMLRRGAAVALDVKDYDAADQLLQVNHRPETGTPIKNKRDGERLIALDESLCAVLDDWLADRRPDVTDEHDREPLLATPSGRPHPQSLQRWSYAATRPCEYGDPCPEDRDPDECDAAGTAANAYSCPASVSPHAIRRGSITHHLKNDVPIPMVGDRANVSPDVLKKHYDRRSERDKVEQRREYLENI